MNSHSLEKSLTAQLAINAATKVNPALKPAADELKSAIACTNVSDDAYLNPLLSLSGENNL
ncbi:hypothetical protein [Nostoc sp. ChiQUE01b]|uniref:hypothetical protein n=1 Tax=Nostoc sp. ChiQUE01b TaxID=3075376 RepID=UPI002AD46F50|nr:hypothetical protein [Nostoc sp. ChiQUE01b]